MLEIARVFAIIINIAVAIVCGGCAIQWIKEGYIIVALFGFLLMMSNIFFAMVNICSAMGV